MAERQGDAAAGSTPIMTSVFGEDGKRAQRFLESSENVLRALVDALGVSRDVVDEDRWRRAVSLLAEFQVAIILAAFVQVGLVRPAGEDGQAAAGGASKEREPVAGRG